MDAFKSLYNPLIVSSTAQVASLCTVAAVKAKMKGIRRRASPRQFIKRRRKTVEQVYRELGPRNFRRAYRMSWSVFWLLAEALKDGIKVAVRQLQLKKDNNNLPESPLHQPSAPNGIIHFSVRLAVALRYFAGGAMFDLASLYGISISSADESVKAVIEAINNNQSFDIIFPTDHDEQIQIAEGYRRVSEANIDCCAGTVDGILIWTTKPTEMDCIRVNCDSGKFFCGRKHKFGLNMQAIADVHGKFLDVSIMYPASTSDTLAFEDSDIYKKLEAGLLAPGLTLFGDNAYMNTTFMATPFTRAGTGQAGTNNTRDDYNFYFSQLRIRIECAFGMLVHRWSMLRNIFPSGVPIARVVSTVIAMVKLHNYLIDNREEIVPQNYTSDLVRAELDENGVVTLEGDNHLPSDLIGGGEHMDDLPDEHRRRVERRFARDSKLPRTLLYNSIVEQGLRRQRN